MSRPDGTVHGPELRQPGRAPLLHRPRHKECRRLHAKVDALHTPSPRQDRTAILGRTPPIFCSFSADFLPKMVHHRCYIYISAA